MEFKGKPDDLKNALTGMHERILYHEGEWYISAQNNPDAKITAKTIDIWHWCRGRGEHSRQYAASVVEEEFVQGISKDRPYIDDDVCWNCKNQECVSIADKTIPKNLKKIGEKLLIGSML